MRGLLDMLPGCWWTSGRELDLKQDADRKDASRVVDSMLAVVFILVVLLLRSGSCTASG